MFFPKGKDYTKLICMLQDRANTKKVPHLSMKFILKYHHHYEYIHGKCCYCKCAVYSCQCDWNCWCKLQFKPRIKFWKSEEIRFMWTVVSKLENKSMLIVHVSIVIILLVWFWDSHSFNRLFYSSRRVLNCQVSLVENLAYIRAPCWVKNQSHKNQKPCILSDQLKQDSLSTVLNMYTNKYYVVSIKL